MQQVETHKHTVKILEEDDYHTLADEINAHLAQPGWVIVNNSFHVSTNPRNDKPRYTVMMLHTVTHVEQLNES